MSEVQSQLARYQPRAALNHVISAALPGRRRARSWSRPLGQASSNS
jgi:hypothetical protein